MHTLSKRDGEAEASMIAAGRLRRGIPGRRPGKDVTRNRRRLTLVLVPVMLFVLACGSGGQGGGGSAGGGTFRVGADADIYTVEPPARASVAVWRPNASVFETLAAATADLRVAPLLATSWEFRAPNTWRFHLRRGVTFHNGVPFDAAAVVHYFNQFLAAPGSPGWVPGVNANSATAVDSDTVDVVTEPVNHQLIRYLTQPQVPVVAPGTYPGPGTSAENTPMGTGPFRFVSYAKGRELVVGRFDGYWGERPQVERIVFRFMPDGNSRVLALQAGEVDAIYDVPRQQTDELGRDPAIEVVRSRVGAYQALMLNKNGKPPYDILSDESVRRAIAYAVNQPAIINNVWQGTAVVQPTIIPPRLLAPCADKVKGYPYDPGEARRLLSSAGWQPGPDGIRAKDGRRLELKLTAYLPDEQRPLPELVKAQLREVGVAVNVVLPPDTAAYSKMLAAGEADIFSEGSGSAVEHPYGMSDNLWQDPTESGSYAIFAPGDQYGYNDVFLRARAATTEESFNCNVAEMLHIIVDQAVVAVPMAGIQRVYGLSDRVQGFVPHYYVPNQQWDMVSLGESR